tara:strand:- start:493 stop:804 length:312 start_codon:yes stop_codon:yes gene_type:complete
MDAKQKYIEDEFEIDEFFLKQMYSFNKIIRDKIASQIDTLDIENTDGIISTISGVAHDDEEKPTFFTIEYFRSPNSPAMLVDVYSISLNEYLDIISKGLKYIK